MEFKMFIGNNLIDSVPVSFSQIRKPGFLEGLTHKLKKKHEDLIQATTETPLYYIEHVPSAMNHKKKKKS
jgi:hypothetical protein